jgi:glutathione S-transferase
MSLACASVSSSCPPPPSINRDRNIVVHNPLGKVPTLITDEGVVLYDSRVICEYLNALGKGNLIPQPGPRAGACSPSSRSPTA